MRVFTPQLMVVSVLLVDLVSGQNTPTSTEILQPQYLTEYDSKRVKIRYGSHSVPSNDMKHYQDPSIDLPCHDCLITWMQAGLEFSDGTVADSSNHIWLHHMFLTNMGRESKSCPKLGLDRFFATGEERTPVNICADGKEKAGYFIAPTDVVAMTTEIMNLDNNPEPANLTVTITWEYVPGLQPSFSQVDTYWLDINGCGPSAQPSHPDTSFKYTSPPFISNSTGHVTFMGSHLHDGGTHLEILKNDILVCNTTASYTEQGHISSISACTSNSLLTPSAPFPPILGETHDKSNDNNLIFVSPDDTLSIIAYYDTSLHKPMSLLPHSNSNPNPDLDSSNQNLEPIMGISLLYIATGPQSSATPLNESPPSSYTNGSLPSRTLTLSLLFLALFAVSIVICSRMHTENKSFTDLCPYLTPCFGIYLIIRNRYFPPSSTGYYDEEDGDGYYEDEDEDEDEYRYGEGEGSSNFKMKTMGNRNGNGNGKGKGSGGGNSIPLLSVRDREKNVVNGPDPDTFEDDGDEEEEEEGKGGWDWEYENENEVEDEYVSGSGSGLKRS